MVIKLTKDYKNFAVEIKTMRRISKFSSGRYSCPEVVAYGMATQNKEVIYAWMIMPRYGHTLDHIVSKLSLNLTKPSVYDIGIAMLNTLKSVHSAGFVYNDLKLDNLMIGYGQKVYKKTNGCSMFRDCSIHLVDFGFASKFVD